MSRMRTSGLPPGEAPPMSVPARLCFRGMDVLATDDWRRRRTIPEVDAELDLVVEDADSGFCGAVVGFELGHVVLEDRHGKRRNIPLEPAAFLLDGRAVTQKKPTAQGVRSTPGRTASGSIAV